MVRLRLTRLGRKKQPFYRIVAADSRAPADGRSARVVTRRRPVFGVRYAMWPSDLLENCIQALPLMVHRLRLSPRQHEVAKTVTMLSAPPINQISRWLCRRLDHFVRGSEKLPGSNKPWFASG
jgi:hypothetical protein